MYSEFFFSKTSCLTKAEEPNLAYYLPVAGGRIIGFIPFPRVLGLCEMQSVSSRIWTRAAVSISYDDNHYTTGTSSHRCYIVTIQNKLVSSDSVNTLFIHIFTYSRFIHNFDRQNHVLRTSIDNIRENGFELRKEAKGTPQKQSQTLTTLMTWRY